MKLKQTNLIKNTHLKIFGSKISELNPDSLNKISFTKVQQIFQIFLMTITNDKNNISAAVILSDGVITDGSNPIYSAEKSGIPVFTVGVGDTAKRKDVEIKNVIL